MASMQGSWVKLDQKGTGPGARSSHAIALVGQKIYAFGGDFTPRVPVDNKLHIFDLETLTWSVADVTEDAPPPRVGVTMAAVGKTIYVFGGRDGTHKELNELYSFDTSTSKWTLLSSADTGPPHRNYHSMTADDRHVYIFGGCGVSGRLNDLWAFDVVDQKWIKYPTPGDNCKGRGGPGLVLAQGKIWVVYGFAGVEMDDVHCFDPAHGQWSQVETSGEKPTACSVFSTVGIGIYIIVYGGEIDPSDLGHMGAGKFSTVGIGKYTIVYGGEIDPSDLGHMGAGKFSGELYSLDTETLVWTRWDDGQDSNIHPGPRGWCAFACGCRDGKQGLLVYGGNSPSNDRLEDIFFLTPSL